MYKKLGSVCGVKGGYAFKSSQFIDNGTPLIRIGNIVNNVVEIENVCIDSNSLDCYKDFIINKGDILVALSGATTGKFGIYQHEKPALLNQRVAKITPTKEIDNRFLYHYMNKLQSIILDKSMGAAQPNISTKGIEELDIFVPSVDEQEKISRVLDIAKELIDKRKEQIEACDELIKGLFYDMFGDIEINNKKWEIKPFEYFVKIDTKMTKEFDKYADSVHLGIENIEKNTGKIIDCKTVSESNITSGKYIFCNNHIIYSKIRPNLNKVALPTFNGICSADAYPLLVKEKFANRIFVGYVLRSNAFLNYILPLSSRTNIPKVNKEQLQGFECILPPIDLQNKFAQKVQKIEQQKSLMQQSLTQLENNFNSLMQRAFKGELF